MHDPKQNQSDQRGFSRFGFYRAFLCVNRAAGCIVHSASHRAFLCVNRAAGFF
jgi:hypothetical protein